MSAVKPESHNEIPQAQSAGKRRTGERVDDARNLVPGVRSGDMMRWVTWTRDRFWLIPGACTVLAFGLGLGLIALDRVTQYSFQLPFVISSGVEGARAVLSAIAGSMITFTGLVFSITIVTLQLTSSQFSPRVLRTFLRDRFNQLTLGIFIATFVYAMVVLRSIRSSDDQVDEFVPQLGVNLAFLLVIASVVVFLLYIHHIAQSIRVATIISSIATDTRALIERRYPLKLDEGEAAEHRTSDGPVGPSRVVAAARPGVIVSVDDAMLARLAENSGSTVHLLRAIGEFVPTGAALLRVFGEDAPRDERLRAGIVLSEERTADQDIGFGLRQLVDIAGKALSPGVNDPTTAIQVIDQLHDLLRRLAARPLPPLRRTTSDGRLAVLVPTPDFETYLVLAVEEIAHYGSDSARLQNRLRGMLRDLHSAALPAHRGAIARQLLRWNEQSGHISEPDLSPSDVGLRPSSTVDFGRL